MKNLSDFLNVQESEMILEMAKLNLKEDSISFFPSNKYRIWVQGDNSPDIPAHLHISCSEESLELKVYIETCEIWAVVSKRKRISKKPEELQDIIKKLKEWFTLQRTMTGRIGTNKETAYNEWVALMSNNIRGIWKISTKHGLIIFVRLPILKTRSMLTSC